MSDGLHKFAIGGLEIPLGGRKIRTAKPSVKLRAEVELRLLSLRPDVLSTVAASIGKFPPHLQQKLLTEAISQVAKNNSATNQEVSDWLNTYDGTMFMLWLLFRGPQNNGEFDDDKDVDGRTIPGSGLAKVAALVGDIPLEVLQAKVDLAMGNPDLKNSAGPEETSPATETSASPGPKSTDGSPTIEAGTESASAV